jgi:hypothetical protein
VAVAIVLPVRRRSCRCTTDETVAYRWETPDDVCGLAEEAYAIRVLDALDDAGPLEIREHDGHHLQDRRD